MYHQKYQSRHQDFVLTIYLLLHARRHTPTSAPPVVIFSSERERFRERKRVRASLLLPCLRLEESEILFSSFVKVVSRRRRSLFSNLRRRRGKISSPKRGGGGHFDLSHVTAKSLLNGRRSVGLIALFDCYAEYAHNCTYLKQLRSSFRSSFRSSGKRTFAKENNITKGPDGIVVVAFTSPNHKRNPAFAPRTGAGNYGDSVRGERAALSSVHRRAVGFAVRRRDFPFGTFPTGRVPDGPTESSVQDKDISPEHR